MKKVLISFITISIICFVFAANVAEAHSGRTDSRGGHKDNKNASGLGSYHYHCGGHPPHLHNNGVCPYSANVAKSVNNPVITKDTITVSDAPSEMKMGDTSVITYKVTGSERNPNVQWKSSDESVVQVGSKGELRAKNPGQATITVSTDTASQSFEVYVSAVPVESIKLSMENADVQLGKNIKVQAQVYPSNASNKEIIWTSDDENIAIVDNNGTVESKSVGEAKITASSSEGVIAVATIKVFEVFAKDITMDEEEIVMDINDTYELSAKVLPDEANNKKLTYESENIDIAEVDSLGRIRPCKEGKTSITISTSNSISKTVEVKVYSKKKRELYGFGAVGFSGLIGWKGTSIIRKRKKHSLRN